MAAPVIALLTDFGLQDTYVGVMKGVILGIAPHVQVIDLTHEIPPQDVRAGAYNLLVSYRYFPAGSLFCCVVDPGVGSERRAVAVRAGAYTFVAPDNGLLTPVLETEPVEMAVVMENTAYHLPNVSATFHGRDIFAPVTAHLARGVPPEALGPPLAPEELVRLPWPQPRRIPDGWEASIVHADRFGNLITNLPGEWLDPPLNQWQVEVGPVIVAGLSRTFADVGVGEPVAYVGSSGYLELAVRQGNARRQWGVGPGLVVRVRRQK